MSFTDPSSVTISGVTTSLPRTSVGENKSEYKSGDGTILLSASHNYGKRVRRMIRIDLEKIAPDPFHDDQNDEVSMSFYMVFDAPAVGFSVAEQLALYTGFKSMISASSDQMVTKLLGGES